MGASRTVTMHYHGTPITPRSVLNELVGCNFCVSFAAPSDAEHCHRIGQSVMLDNGAFSVWRRGAVPDWPGYYEWCAEWLRYPTTWAVIPDVIAGTEGDNDELIREWPFGDRGAPVWHMHETISRLVRLCDAWPRVCLGSSAQFADIGSDAWRRRMDEAMNAVCMEGFATTWLHMLRGMNLSGSEYPFASVDSTDIAQNHHRPQNTAVAMARRWDGIQNTPHWTYREQLKMEAA